MQRVFFCSGSTFETGDLLAAAVLDYAQALGELQRFDTVRLPIRRLDGTPAWATLLLGPVSQISTESVESDVPDLVEPEVVERLRVASRRLRDPLVPVHPERDEWEEDLLQV